MREFHFESPYKCERTTVHGYKEQNIDRNHFSRYSCVVTRYGIVMVNEFRWETNFGIDIFSRFFTVLDGMIHSAYIKEAPLSEIQRKWLATNFIKKAMAGLDEPAKIAEGIVFY